MTKMRIQEVISEILINKEISLNTLPAFALYYKARIIIVKDNRIYLDIVSEDDYDIIILMNKTKENNYNVDLIPNKKKIDEIIKTCICLYSYEKPLKAISNFKINELTELALKVGIDINDKISKNDKDAYSRSNIRNTY